MLRPTVTLDAAMTAQQALRQLALNGYWLSADQPEARERIEAYIARLRRVATARTVTAGGSPTHDDDVTQAWLAEQHAAHERPRADPATLTVEQAATMLARPVDEARAAIYRRDGVTIFWYARDLRKVLETLSQARKSVRLVDALGLHEFTASPTAQATQLDDVRLERFEGVVLQDLQAVAVGDSSPSPYDWADRGTARSIDDAAHAPGVRSRTPSPGTLGPTPGSADVEVRAHPFLDAPQTVVVAQPFTLTIGLSEQPVAGVESAGPMTLRAPAGAESISVDVQVIADGFIAPGGWRRRLAVEVANPTARTVQVELEAEPQDDAVRLTRLIVHYLVDGVACGSAARSIVVERTAGASPPVDERGQSWTQMQLPAPVLTLSTGPAKPDVELDIAKPNANPVSGEYVCVMRNAHGVSVPDAPLPVSLGQEAKSFAKEIIDDMQRYAGDPLLDNWVVNTGIAIAEKLPTAFWQMLRDVAARVKGRPVTLQINSAEPYVPWELAIVDPPLDDARPKFLAAQAVVGRWILGNSSIAAPPDHAVTVKAMAVMAGMYNVATGLMPLPSAQQEVKALATAYAALPTVLLDCTSANVKTLLDAKLTTALLDPVGGAEAVHFAGHGQVDPTRPGDAAFFLSNGMPLAPRLFRRSKLGTDHAPFLFLNACMVGTGGEVLGDYGGFPGECLAGGFTALVAPLWAVNDDVAKSIAIEFYKQALDASKPRPVAEVLRDIRAKYRSDQPVSSYLAYVYYGNPQLTLTR